MDTPKNPWAPTPEMLNLEFQQKTLEELRKLIQTFAKQKDILYEIEKEHYSITISRGEGDFPALLKYAGEMVHILNQTLANHKKGFRFEIEEKTEGFTIRVVPR